MPNITNIEYIDSLDSLTNYYKKNHPLTLLKFYSENCPPCKIITENLNNYEGKKINLINLNVSTCIELTRFLEIKNLPTFVYLKDMKVVLKKKIFGMEEFYAFVEEASLHENE